MNIAKDFTILLHAKLMQIKANKTIREGHLQSNVNKKNQTPCIMYNSKIIQRFDRANKTNITYNSNKVIHTR